MILLSAVLPVLTDPNCPELCSGLPECKSCDANKCSKSSRCEDRSLCIQGCQNFALGISQGCQVACSNFTSLTLADFGQGVTSSGLTCQFGCQAAVQDVVNKVNLTLPVFEPPSLIATSLTSDSLALSYRLPHLIGPDLLSNYWLQAKTVLTII